MYRISRRSCLEYFAISVVILLSSLGWFVETMIAAPILEALLVTLPVTPMPRDSP